MCSMGRLRPQDTWRGPSLGGFGGPNGEASKKQHHDEAQPKRELPCKTLEEHS